MKKLIVISFLISSACVRAAKPSLAKGPFEPTDESLKQYRCPEWFRDAKFGIWAVWGPQNVPMHGDWYARKMYIPGDGDYKHHLEHYGHPSKFGFKDMVDRYHPDLLYSDSPLPYPKEVGQTLLAHYYNDNIQRHGGKLEAVYNCKQDSQGRWVQDLERGVMHGINPNPWQTDTCVGNWYYQTGCGYKSPEIILQMLADIVAKNGNLLLNFPPRPDGTLDESEENILADLAAWMPVNGEAIFGTRPWQVYGEGPSKVKKGANFNEGSLKYTPRDIRFTTKGDALYALALGWPADGKIIVQSLAKAAGRISDVALLGCKDKLVWSQTDEGLVVTMPEQKPCEHVFALKVAGVNISPAPLPAGPVILPTVIVPDAVGHLLLTGSTAQIKGETPEYIAAENQIGFWSNPSDYVCWDFMLPKAGTYAVKITYSCDPAARGSVFTVENGGAKLEATSKSTGSWRTHTTETLGELTLAAGKQTLAVKPKPMPKWKVIGIRSVELQPVNK